MYIGFTPTEEHLNKILYIHTPGVTGVISQTNAQGIGQSPSVEETNGDIGIAECEIELEHHKKKRNHKELSQREVESENEISDRECELFDIIETHEVENSNLTSSEESFVLIEVEEEDAHDSKWKINKCTSVTKERKSGNSKSCPHSIPVRIITEEKGTKLNVKENKKILNGNSLRNINIEKVNRRSPLHEKDSYHYTYNNGNNTFVSCNLESENINVSESQSNFEQNIQMGMTFVEKLKNLLRFQSCDNQQGKRKRSSDDLTTEKPQQIKYRKVENKFPKYIENNFEDDVLEMTSRTFSSNKNIYTYRSSTPIWNTNKMDIFPKDILTGTHKQRKSMFIPPEIRHNIVKNNCYAEIDLSDDDVEFVQSTKYECENGNLKDEDNGASVSNKNPQVLLGSKYISLKSNDTFRKNRIGFSRPTYASVLKQIDYKDNWNEKMNAHPIAGSSSSNCTPNFSNYNSLRKSPLPTNFHSIMSQEKVKDDREQYRQLLEQMVPRIYGSEREKLKISNSEKYTARSLRIGERRLLSKVQCGRIPNNENTGQDRNNRTPYKENVEKMNMVNVVIDDSDEDDVSTINSGVIKKKSLSGNNYKVNLDSVNHGTNSSNILSIMEPVNSLEKHLNSLPQLKMDWLESLKSKWNEKKKQRSQELKDTFEVAQRLSAERRVAEVEIGERLRNFQIIDPEIIVIDEFPEPDEADEVFELTQDQRAKIKSAVYGPPDEVLITKFNLNITRRDIHTLLGHNWLNDEVINFYMSLLTERSEKKHDSHAFPRVYAMNTFFVPRLMQSGHSGVKRWTRKVDIFAKDIIPVPVHVGGVHWCMAIIHLKKRTIKYYDSMGTPNPNVLKALEQYLKDESMDKKKQNFDTSNFEIFSVEDVPRQMNGSDCGVFSCMFAEFITRNKEITFTQQHMEYFRNKMILEIVQGELIN